MAGWSERSREERERARAERVARRSGTALEEPPRVPRRGPPPRRRSPRPRSHWPGRILALLALAAIGVALYAINATFQPFHGEGSGSVAVKIPAGADAGRIGDILEQRRVIDSSTFFVLNATVTGRRGGLRPGSYTLRRGMTNGDAIAALTKGPKTKVVPTVNVTIPEGP